MRLAWPFGHRHPDDDPEADARFFGVDEVVYADVPAWWFRLKAPFALHWKREAAFFAGLVLVGFVAGALVGVIVLR